MADCQDAEMVQSARFPLKTNRKLPVSNVHDVRERFRKNDRCVELGRFTRVYVDYTVIRHSWLRAWRRYGEREISYRQTRNE